MDRVNRLAQEEGVSVAERVSVAPCDVGDEEQVAAFMDACGPSCDALVHSIAYASRQAMTQPFLQCTQEQFSEATAVSAHSLVTLARHAAPKLSDRASILAMSYIGAHRVRAGDEKRMRTAAPSLHTCCCCCWKPSLSLQAAAEYNAMGPAKAALEATVRQLAVEMVRRGQTADAELVPIPPLTPSPCVTGPLWSAGQFAERGPHRHSSGARHSWVHRALDSVPP